MELVDTKRVEEVEVVGRGGRGGCWCFDSDRLHCFLDCIDVHCFGFAWGLSFMIGFGNVDVDANVAEAVAVIQ